MSFDFGMAETAAARADELMAIAAWRLRIEGVR